MMDILFEDNQIIVAVKPAGVLSQADPSGDPDMLTLLKAYIKERYNKPGNVYLGLVHRLDRPVSGVMVFAKTSKAAARLSEQIRLHTVDKYYLAAVSGVMENDSGTLANYILKDQTTNRVKVFDTPKKDAKYAELDYEVIARSGNMTLLKVDLKTGRSHQIRAQLANAGHPIICDSKYGSNRMKGDIALFCCEMAIDHPVSKERMVFKADPPKSYPWGNFAY